MYCTLNGVFSNSCLIVSDFDKKKLCVKTSLINFVRTPILYNLYKTKKKVLIKFLEIQHD